MGAVALLAVVATACGTESTSTDGDSGSGSDGASTDPIKIALIADQTGSLAFYGGRATEGWNLALEAVDGKVAGRQIEYVPVQCDTPADCGADTTRTIKEKGVELVLGTPGSALAVAAREAANRAGVVYMESASLGDDVLPAGDAELAFRAGPDTSLLAKGTVTAVEDWAAANGSDLSTLTAVVVNENSAGNHLSAELQAELVADLGVTIADTVEYEVKSADLAQVAARVVAADPDVLIEVSYVADSVTLNTSLAQRGWEPDLHVISGTPAQQQLDGLGADYLQGVVHSTFPAVDTKGATGTDEFIELHEAELGVAPPDAYAITYYASARILFDILELSKGSTDPETFKAAVMEIDEPLGSYANGWGAKFDGHGQNTLAMASVMQWQSGVTCTVLPSEFAACELEK